MGLPCWISPAACSIRHIAWRKPGTLLTSGNVTGTREAQGQQTWKTGRSQSLTMIAATKQQATSHRQRTPRNKMQAMMSGQGYCSSPCTVFEAMNDIMIVCRCGLSLASASQFVGWNIFCWVAFLSFLRYVHFPRCFTRSVFVVYIPQAEASTWRTQAESPIQLESQWGTGLQLTSLTPLWRRWSKKYSATTHPLQAPW